MRLAIARAAVGGCLAAATAAGCAGLEARRVPLQARLAGQDANVQGFRYYLSRPYLVVSDRVNVVTTEQWAVVVTFVADPPARPGMQPVAAEKPSGEFAANFPFPKPGDLPPPPPLERLAVVKAARLEAFGPTGEREYYDLYGQRTSGPPVGFKAVPLSFDEGKAVVAAATTVVAPGAGNTHDAGAAAPKAEGPSKPPTAASNPGQVVDQHGDRFAAGVLDSSPVVTYRNKATTNKANEPAADTFKIVYLPDFEEQMAVDHKAVAAKSKIGLSFLDGWQLRSVEENTDTTTVPIKILQVVKTAISAAGEVEQKRLELAGTAAEREFNLTKGQDAIVRQAVRVVIRRTLYIEPGMYRLQKDCERGGEPLTGVGLLTDLGIPVCQEVQVGLRPNK